MSIFQLDQKILRVTYFVLKFKSKMNQNLSSDLLHLLLGWVQDLLLIVHYIRLIVYKIRLNVHEIRLIVYKIRLITHKIRLFVTRICHFIPGEYSKVYDECSYYNVLPILKNLLLLVVTLFPSKTLYYICCMFIRLISSI